MGHDWPGRLIDFSRRLLMANAFAFGVPLAALAIGLSAQLMSMLNHDTAWYLYAGARFLDGGTLYRDIFVEVNPPLGLFLTLPPVILARHAGLFPVSVFTVYVYLLIALSLTAVWGLLSSSKPGAPVMRRGLLIAATAVLIVSPADQFGQREHFLAILTLPYMFLIARGLAGAPTSWPLALILGLAAGLGFALKPHYLLVPLAFEIYRLAVSRRLYSVLRPETLGLGATVIGYAGVVVILTPDYLTRVVPYALEVYNLAYTNPLWINLLRVETAALPLGCWLHLATRRRQAAPHFGDVFLIASVSLFLAYVVQMKGWDYHLYPASACLVLAAAALFLNATCPPRDAPVVAKDSKRTHAAALAALSAIAVLLASDATKFGYKNRFTDIMSPYLESYAEDGSIAVLGGGVWSGFPLVNMKRVGWSSRFPTLWMLPGVAIKRNQGGANDRSVLDEIEAYTRDTVVADFLSAMPDLVFVDERDEKQYFGRIQFDYLDYFGRDPRFIRIWSDYIKVDEAAGFDIYRRRCAPGC